MNVPVINTQNGCGYARYVFLSLRTAVVKGRIFIVSLPVVEQCPHRLFLVYCSIDQRSRRICNPAALPEGRANPPRAA
jgi:hypothetical protein